MVDITTAVVDVGTLVTWDAPGGPASRSVVPRGEMRWDGSAVVPSKLAADENLWTLAMQFPGNFVYRLVEARIFQLAATDVPAGKAKTLTGTITSDAPGEDDLFFQMYNATNRDSDGDFDAYEFTFTSTAAHMMTFYEPSESWNKLSAPIDAGGDSARIFMRWCDASGTITDACTFFWRFRALVYDIDQARSWQMHTPLPVIAA